jgi:hypothetical protein
MSCQRMTPTALSTSRVRAQDMSRRRDGCWSVFIVISLRSRELVEPAMPRGASQREGRSEPQAAISRRIRPNSDGLTPEARRASASHAASRTGVRLR